jgi:hypothetical protein
MTDAAAAPQEHLSDLRLDRLVTDELQGEELAAARAHLEACGDCRAREKELRDDRAAFERSHLADDARVPRFDGEQSNVVSLAAYRRGRVTQALALVGTVAAAVLVLVVLPGEDDVTPPARTKGSASLSFFVKDAAGVRPGASGETVHPGDQLRFVITSKQAGYAAVLSLDGAGTISVYVADGDQLLAVPAGKHSVPRATELDDVLGPERLYGFLCSAESRVEDLRAAVAARAEDPAPPPGCVVDVLTIEKTAR